MKSSPICSLAALCLVLTRAAGQANASVSANKFTFSDVKARQFPGGTYKATSTAVFPASKKLAGGVITLNAGGLREPHWHNPAEWAIVLSGSCRAVALEQGKTRPSDDWDYETGDVWYFGAGIAHSILGLSPAGCSYLAVYNDGTFDESLASFDLSKWVALLPPAILAQHLNTSVLSLTSNLAVSNTSVGTANLRSTSTDGFIVQGPPGIEQDSRPSLPLQTPLQSHRYALKSSSASQVSVEGGGSVTYVDDTLFPISKKTWGGILHLEPNALRVSHWHLNSDEFQYIANGTEVEIGNFLESGELVINTYKQGDVGLSPQGAAHYLKNKGNTSADIIVVFNAAQNTGIDLSWTLGSFPNSWIAASLNATTNYTSGLAKQYKSLTANIVPASLSVPSSL